MIVDEVSGSNLKGDMAGLAGHSFHVTRGEGMSVPWRFLIFTSIMASFTRMHGVVEVIPYSLPKGIPFSEIVFPVTRMARNTMQVLGLMDICLRAPLTSPLPSVGKSR